MAVTLKLTWYTWLSAVSLLNNIAQHSLEVTANCAGCNPLVGAYSGCNTTNGQCNCLTGVTGTLCDHCQDGYFLPPLDGITLQAREAACTRKFENGNSEQFKCSVSGGSTSTMNNGSIEIGYYTYCRQHDCFSGASFARSISVTFKATVPKSTNYSIVLRYTGQRKAGNWKDVKVYPDIDSPGFVHITDPCYRLSVLGDQIRKHTLTIPPEPDGRTPIFQPFCLPQGVKLTLTIEFPRPQSSFYFNDQLHLHSVVLIPDLSYALENVSFTMKDLVERCILSTANATGVVHQIPPFCAGISFVSISFLYGGCLECKCGVGYCNQTSGQCRCRTGWSGSQCERCDHGYYATSSRMTNNGNITNTCLPCQCNGLAQTCNPLNGTCIDCKNNTVGQHCQSCLPGYVTVTATGSLKGCQPSTISFSKITAQAMTTVSPTVLPSNLFSIVSVASLPSSTPIAFSKTLYSPYVSLINIMTTTTPLISQIGTTPVVPMMTTEIQAFVLTKSSLSIARLTSSTRAKAVSSSTIHFIRESSLVTKMSERTALMSSEFFVSSQRPSVATTAGQFTRTSWSMLNVHSDRSNFSMSLTTGRLRKSASTTVRHPMASMTLQTTKTAHRVLPSISLLGSAHTGSTASTYSISSGNRSTSQLNSVLQTSLHYSTVTVLHHSYLKSHNLAATNLSHLLLRKSIGSSITITSTPSVPAESQLLSLTLSSISTAAATSSLQSSPSPSPSLRTTTTPAAAATLFSSFNSSGISSVISQVSFSTILNTNSAVQLSVPKQVGSSSIVQQSHSFSRSNYFSKLWTSVMPSTSHLLLVPSPHPTEETSVGLSSIAPSTVISGSQHSSLSALSSMPTLVTMVITEKSLNTTSLPSHAPTHTKNSHLVIITVSVVVPLAALVVAASICLYRKRRRRSTRYRSQRESAVELQERGNYRLLSDPVWDEFEDDA
ncbi:mucin-2-like [Corticium candelabrum]|uniref:mucin-2-like n=1 Tax=Corticium candelabrum TaxID=121492 RepID=UPI002E26B81D|nr:mucin-2-like [Corticium candelabrum]